MMTSMLAQTVASAPVDPRVFEPQRGGTEYVVLVGLFLVIALLFLGFRAWLETRRDRERHLTIRSYLEKALPVPESMLATPDAASRVLRNALATIALGGALAVVFTMIPGVEGMWALGLLPVAVGVAQLAAALVGNRK